MLERLCGLDTLCVWVVVMAAIGAVWVIHWSAVRLWELSKRFTFVWPGALLLNKVRRSYKSRIRWRVEARLSAFLHSHRTGPGLRMPRVLGVILAGSMAALFVLAVIFGLNGSQSIEDIARHLLFDEQPSAGTWSLFYALAISPVALVLWIFRDANQVQQIENQRKDINLKDFQKLCEWASGSALVEDEVTSGSDGIQSIKSSKLPEQSSPHGATRRQGCEALQIASIQQLGSYLLGENGQQFQRPALEMLIALWQSQTEGIRSTTSNWLGLSDTEGRRTATGEWLNAVADIQNSVLARAITYALLAKENRGLLLLAEFLPKQSLTGFRTDFPGLKPLKLWNCNLDGIDLQGGKLYKAELQGASLFGAQMNGAELTSARLQGANLNSSALQHARLHGAQLQGAVLRFVQAKYSTLISANLQNADLYWAGLEFAELESTDLQGARLFRTRIQGASLRNADLRGTAIISPLVNEQTRFDQAITDEATSVGFGHELAAPGRKGMWRPVLTHALRLRLRSTNRLELPSRAYEEFAEPWAMIEKSKQDAILERVFSYSENLGLFSQEYPELAAA